ncbi:MAG: DUF4384 domain-containing protein [Polyangiaceae bacterium]|nr:DUF4384 domain-containing protein [Polyangiaceae bacterium]
MTLVSRRVGDDCVSDKVLDELHLELLDAPEAERVEQHLAACDVCAGRRLSLTNLRSDIERELPPLRIGIRAATPFRTRAFERGFAPLVVGALALAAATTMMIATNERHTGGSSSGPPTGSSDQAGIRTKGSLYELAATVERGGHQFRVVSSDVVRVGDRIQLSYSTPSGVHLYLLGTDGTGELRRYFPEASRSARVEEGREVELPFSLVLDDAPGPEHFIGFFCQSPTAFDLLENRAREVASSLGGTVVAGCAEVQLELAKQ